MVDYYQKYLKYKAKYLKLQKQLGGSCSTKPDNGEWCVCTKRNNRGVCIGPWKIEKIPKSK